MKSPRSGAHPRPALTAALFAFASVAQAQPTINLAELTTRSVSLQCLDYHPLAGMCVWLDCSLLGCSNVTVPKIRHRIPDVVVSA